VVGGLVAGFVNTLAGGGSFLTVPLLILVGLPATVANATNRLGVLIQSLTAIAGFRQEGVWDPKIALRLLPPVLVGSWLGAFAAASVPDALFQQAFGVVMLGMLPLVLLRPRPADGARLAVPLWLEAPLYLALGFYGGAVQAGIGIPLVLALVSLSGLGLVRAAGVRVLLTAALTAVALAEFIRADKVAWLHALVLAAGSGAGGYVAARFGARVGDRLIRPLLVVAVVALALRLLLAAG
jgi:uncharacterized membrane protein YfcA